MKSCSYLPSLLASLALSASVQADSILWVSDNGLKSTDNGSDGAKRGAFYPAASTNGTPFVDQGFVDLLASAGHRVTRFNPASGTMSLDDVPLINSYDLVILGSALNSGPFNLNARGPKWNTMITKPMIITKSTLIRRDRMGYLKDNKEFDCAADESVSASGRLKFKVPSHPIFQGISGREDDDSIVMDNYFLNRIGNPVNNRGASVQYFQLSIDGVEQTISNAVEPGGTELATIDFNPLDPGVNIPAGQVPEVNVSYRATGYAIVEWPAGTIVRTTQVAGETNASYRLLFACGTRDASGSVTASPNPQAGALDLSPDGQVMFLNAVNYALSKGPPRMLASQWGQWDYKQYLYGGVGNLVLSNETAGGFTAWVATNDVDAVNNTTGAKGGDGLIEAVGRPAIFQEFDELDLSHIGQKVTASFDIKFNNALAWSDQFVRFGFGNRANNSSFYLKIDSGLGGGTTLGWRSDATITDTNGLTLISPVNDPDGNILTATNLNVPVKGPNGGFVSGNYGHFLNSGSIPGAAYPGPISAYPNGVGVGLADTLDVVHSITMSMERVDGGLKIVGTWGNSAGPQVLSSTYSSPYNDQPLEAGGHGRLDRIGCLGFNLMNNDLFTNGYAGGSYRVSNFTLDYVTPPILRVTKTVYDAADDILTLTWVSEPGATYAVEFNEGWTGWFDGIDDIISQGNTTTTTIASPISGTFYRIRKQ